MFNPDPKPEPRKKKEKKYISKAGNKMTDLYKEYKVIRLWYLEYNPKCERCGTKGSQIHHKRGRVGKLLIDREYFMTVCFQCHRYIEDNPVKAKENGWSISRLT